MEALGVQLSSQNILQIPLFPTQQIVFPLSGRSKTFIPASSIQDIVLLEGIQGWSIIWYLAIAQRDKEGTKLHVTFKVGQLDNRLHCLVRCSCHTVACSS